jgi:cytochrome P450
MLDQHPLVARDLADELDTPGGVPITLNGIAGMKLLEAVVKETMRILPPVPQQFRVALQDTELDGVPLPKRSRVLLSGWLTNRDPDLYPAPNRFLPTRWQSIDPTPYEYSAFSAGPRGCPGYWFGLSVVKTAIATILRRFRPALVPDTRIDYKVKVTLSPRRAVPALLLQRDQTFTAAPLRGTIRDLVQLN